MNIPQEKRAAFAFLVILTAITFAYWAGVPHVPFHPDESTYLFTSADLEIFLRRPADVFWSTGRAGDLRQHYRLLDPPLHRSLIGISRWISGQKPLPVDWNWSAAWEENARNGALPAPALLAAGRMASAVLFPFSILFLYLAARKTFGELTAWTAALLLASNALVLLHTRRAMAEGPLLFAVTFSLWSLVQFEKRPVWTAIPTSLAFCAKQSLAALSPIGLLSVLLPNVDGKPRSLKIIVSQAGMFVFLSLLVIGLAYPFLWGTPVGAAAAALQARQDLAARQTADRPEQVLGTFPLKLASLVAHVYLSPPVFSETANYQAETQAAEQAYLANPFHNLFRSIPAGTFFLVLSSFGFASSLLALSKQKEPYRRRLILLLSASLLQGLVIFTLIPLPWQRYYLPLVPFACLWSAAGASTVVQMVGQALPVRRNHPGAL